MASFKVPRTLGSSAGLLALGLVVFSAAGAIWGVFRPTFNATVAGHGRISLDFGQADHFQAFASFVIVTAVLSIALGLFSFLTQRQHSVLHLLWVGVVAALSALSFLAVGDVIASAGSSAADAEVGTEIVVAASVNPSIAGFAVAPFLAMATYWSMLALSPGERSESRTELSGATSSSNSHRHDSTASAAR